MDSRNLAEWVEGMVKDFVLISPDNSLNNGEKAWAEPLVGFASGADPLFEAYKEYVGPFHLTPLEMFSRTFPSIEARADQLTVISWILPQTERTKFDNRKETLYPSERWVRARMFGEEANVKLRQYVIASLKDSGYRAFAPQLSPYWERKHSDRYGAASNWSERHAAYASGLGTFGLSDGLITPMGKAMRCGSVIAQMRIPATNRLYQDHHAYCLFFSEGTCGMCMKRCPADAISEAGHDKVKCSSYSKSMIRDYVKTHYHIDGYGCGLCQTGVPCESHIPHVKGTRKKGKKKTTARKG